MAKAPFTVDVHDVSEWIWSDGKGNVIERLAAGKHTIDPKDSPDLAAVVRQAIAADAGIWLLDDDGNRVDLRLDDKGREFEGPVLPEGEDKLNDISATPEEQEAIESASAVAVAAAHADDEVDDDEEAEG